MGKYRRLEFMLIRRWKMPAFSKQIKIKSIKIPHDIKLFYVPATTDVKRK